MKRQNIVLLSKPQILEVFEKMGEPSFRHTQVVRWLWKNMVTSFDEMTNVSLSLREKLTQEFYIKWPKIIQKQKSNDGTIKYLVELEDGKTVESVWIPRTDQGRVTLCVSSQVGCRIGCKFCLTAQQKTERDLSAGEIAAQCRIMPAFERLTNVVLMGMGEPFDNYENVIGGLELITDPSCLEIAPRRITVSTSGLIPKIKSFVKDTKCRLAISLNASNDVTRTQLMPINKAYNLQKLTDALKEISSDDYPRQQKSNFYITFEYILIKGLNDQPIHAHEVAELLKGIPCKINLLQYNENPNIPFKRPDLKTVMKFQDILRHEGYLVFIRSSRGRDISAACGQLASESKRESLPSGSVVDQLENNFINKKRPPSMNYKSI